MSFSQITITSLMIGAPIHPATPQDPVPFIVNTPPVQQAAEPINISPIDTSPIDTSPIDTSPIDTTGVGPVSPDDSREALSLDPTPDGLSPVPEEPGNGEPNRENNVVNVIIVTARPETPADPLMELNADSYGVVQDVDRAFVEPIAMAYKEVIPVPIRSGLRNFLRNLGEPAVFFNFLLQLKPGKAFETLGRFTINTTIGIGGLLDVAKKPPFYLPHRSNGFANTFGYYGIEPGPFLFLPLVGPTTARDLVGGGLNLLFLPTVVGKPFTERALTVPTGILSTLDDRIELDEQISEIRDGDADPYTTAREFYLSKRQTEIDILRGRLPDPLSRKSRGTGPAPSPEAEPDAASVTSPLAPEVNFGVSHPVDAPEAETDAGSSTPDPSSYSKEPLTPDLSRAPATPHFPHQSGAAAGSY